MHTYLTRPTLGVTVGGLVEWGGVGWGVAIDDVMGGGAAGPGRLLSLHTVGDRTGT